MIDRNLNKESKLWLKPLSLWYDQSFVYTLICTNIFATSAFFLFWIYTNIWCIHSTSKQWIRSVIEEKVVRYKQTLVMKNWRKSGPVRSGRYRLCSRIIVLFKYFKNSLNLISFRRRNCTLKSTYIIWSMNGSEQE